MTPNLKALFESILKLSVASPLVLLGCGPTIDTRPFTHLSCNTNGALTLEGLKPAQAVDYTELRTSNGAGATVVVLSSTGTRCGTATQVAACTDALAALRSDAGFGGECFDLCSRSALATTKGDTVALIDTQERLKAFLGTIDAPQEAALLVWSGGVALSCTDLERGGVRQTAAGYEVLGTTGTACGTGTVLKRVVLQVAPDGALTTVKEEVIAYGDPNCAIGRRPHGLQVSARRGSGLAGFFAQAAQLEAAAVPAFLRMERELAMHQAPRALRERARAAAADEVRHTRTTVALAERFGGRPVPPRVAALPLRPLFEVALDNVVEGCVRETFGALTALHQARHAQDVQVREALEVIATEEASHAALSWDLHAWAVEALSEGERAQLERARAQAVDSLQRELEVEVDPSVQAAAGMPSRAQALALLAGLRSTVWA